jgi:hypothetical protein
MFSANLSRAIQREISMHAQELGDELDGVEEVVGDGLTGEARNEWEALIEAVGFDALMKAIKTEFL